MADESSKSPIIIKKINKGEHAHHGGAWKIAYADFVTAMMAFFLLLWLLNSVTQEQLEGISNYFAPVSASQSNSGAGGILGGKTMSEEGAAINETSRDSVTVDLPPPKAGTGGQDNADTQAQNNETPSEAQAEQVLKQAEQQQFQKAKEQLEATIESIPQLKKLKDSLLIDNTPDGLRIQLVDKNGLSMFPSGGSDLYLHTKRLLEVAAEIIKKLPQNISISGHTDATKFGGGGDYTNWELSADRANAARRWLEHLGIPDSRISQVVGKAATDPLVKDNPNHPSNRRLSIIMLRGTGKNNPVAKFEKAVKEGKPLPEALPGLNEIKRKQLDGIPTGLTAPSRATTAPPTTTAPPAGDGVPHIGLELDNNLSK